MCGGRCAVGEHVGVGMRVSIVVYSLHGLPLLLVHLRLISHHLHHRLLHVGWHHLQHVRRRHHRRHRRYGLLVHHLLSHLLCHLLHYHRRHGRCRHIRPHFALLQLLPQCRGSGGVVHWRQTALRQWRWNACCRCNRMRWREDGRGGCC